MVNFVGIHGTTIKLFSKMIIYLKQLLFRFRRFLVLMDKNCNFRTSFFNNDERKLNMTSVQAKCFRYFRTLKNFYAFGEFTQYLDYPVDAF